MQLHDNFQIKQLPQNLSETQIAPITKYLVWKVGSGDEDSLKLSITLNSPAENKNLFVYGFWSFYYSLALNHKQD